MKAIAGVCAIGLCLTTIAILQRPSTEDDFRGFYRGAELVGTRDGVYSHPALSPDTGREDHYLAYVRLPSYALMLRPLIWLPYRAARIIWIGLIVAALAALLPLYPPPRDKLAVALSFSVPVVYAVMLGQDIPFVILIALLAGKLFASDKEFSAGLMASLLAIKPTFLLPGGIVILARSRRGTFGLALGVTLQLALSFAVEGPRWPLTYLALLRNPMLDPEPRRMPDFRAIAASLSLPAEVHVVASLAVLIWLWTLARKIELREALMLALPLGMIASPHSYLYDGVVLIPSLVRFASLDSIRGAIVAIALTPLPYLALITDGGPAFLPGDSLLLLGSLSVVSATLVATARAARTGMAACLRDTAQPIPQTPTA